jgi:hypothetical protein
MKSCTKIIHYASLLLLTFGVIECLAYRKTHHHHHHESTTPPPIIIPAHNVNPPVKQKSYNLQEASIAIGIFSFVNNCKTFPGLISEWWHDGLSGCLFAVDHEMNQNSFMDFDLPQGLKLCEYSDEVLKLTSYSSSSNIFAVKVAMGSTLLYQQFSHCDWFLLTDDDSFVSIIPLLEWLRNFDSRDQW